MSAKAKKKAVYPGSFDPITLGHVDIVRRISELFDEVVVLVSHAEGKSALFSVQERVQMAQKSLQGIKNVRVDSFDGLTVDYAKKIGARILVRGLRAVVDFEYEASMGNINRVIGPGIETLLVLASPEYYFVSSRMVKDAAKNGGEVRSLVPACVLAPLKSKYKNLSKNKSGARS
jgi:pantetheine-phosphate adenylyltransferase